MPESSFSCPGNGPQGTSSLGRMRTQQDHLWERPNGAPRRQCRRHRGGLPLGGWLWSPLSHGRRPGRGVGGTALSQRAFPSDPARSRRSGVGHGTESGMYQGGSRSRFSESGWYFNGPLNVKRMFPSRVQASPSSSLCDRGVGWGWRGRGGGRQAWFPDRLHAMPRGSGFTTPMQQGQTPIPSPEVCMDDAIKSVYGCLRPFKDIHKDPALASQVPASNTYGVYILVGEAEHEQDA